VISALMTSSYFKFGLNLIALVFSYCTRDAKLRKEIRHIHNYLLLFILLKIAFETAPRQDALRRLPLYELTIR